MTPAELETGARLLAAATPGPWHTATLTKFAGKFGYRYGIVAYENQRGPIVVAKVETLPIDERTANASAIAWLRTHAAELIAMAAAIQIADKMRSAGDLGYHDGHDNHCATCDIVRAYDAARASGTEGA